mgnify:CR=1 FL=1
MDNNSDDNSVRIAKKYTAFDAEGTLSKDQDFLFSIGGDGTLLRSIPYVKDTEIPILGINTGRLGFLTSLQKESLNEALDKFFDKKFNIYDLPEPIFPVIPKDFIMS